MKFLKIAVVVMGVLIILGTAVVIVELIRRATPSARPPAHRPDIISHEAPFDTTLPLPAGSRVAGVTATADRVVVRVVPTEADGGGRLLFLDPRTGALRGTVTLVPAP